MRPIVVRGALVLLALSGFATAWVVEETGSAHRVIDAIPGVERPQRERAREIAASEAAARARWEALESVVVPASPGDDVYLGLYAAGLPAEGAVRNASERLGATPAIAMWFQQWGKRDPFPVDDVRRLVDRGVVPMVTWEAWRAPEDVPPLDPRRDPASWGHQRQPDFRLVRIAEGAFDGYVDRYARAVADYGGPVMIRLFHEMDGFWYPWGGTVNGNEPGDLVAAWRHVVDRFRAAGADNVTWVWSVNHVSVPSSPDNEPEDYWPGAEYVDWVGLSGFNFGTPASSEGSPAGSSTWTGFAEVFDDRLAELARFDRPLVIAEFASAEEGGDKAGWIRDAFEEILRRHEVDAVVWFDRRAEGEPDWRVASSVAALKAFREAAGSPGLRSAPAALRAVLGG